MTTRRDRMRRATLAEIRAAARRLLTAKGPAAVTVNAVAREVGMSGPALYHYFAGHDDLVAEVAADFFRELTAAMEAARDACPADAPGDRLLAACRAMRAWAVAHPAEFRWVFASPVPAGASAQRPGSERDRAGRDFELVFLRQVEALWARAPFPVPGEPPPPVREGLTAYRDDLGLELPVAALHVAMGCWIRLYGLLCMEALGQLDFAYSDIAPLYEEALRDIARGIGFEYRPPG
ncbi:TetR/AcrR family transcriptional regulator [Actinomadura kijaniata]|uniref:AcrR family transcriptional regulator n=1 Tax=Actinomadura namibiensis TaxID=182080 RepID=A0A7W3M0K9_ACTNM|nr:WHG domain-containing protein [Actinomadura namibiensis]MBA8957653.1 AcrR family transcriptional regulator [Actinomadura namibiensis]